jgi:hypothetical protein
MKRGGFLHYLCQIVIDELERKLHQLISEISLREFGEAPTSISRMRNRRGANLLIDLTRRFARQSLAS